MIRFEEDLSNSGYSPRIWLRYMDDVFVIFDLKVYNIDSFLSKLHSCFCTVNSTAELEKYGQLLFLDGQE